MLDTRLATRLASLLDRDRVFTDVVDCYAYAYDNTRKIFPPDAVVFPESADEVRKIVALCNEYQVPLVARGRGTGTAGGSLPERGGIVLSLERMRRIVAVDPANRVIVVEPGLLNQEVQDAAAVHGYFWPPDPSSASYCSVGGNLATCAAGPHAVKYGTARDHVLGLQAVTGAGDLIRTGCYTTKGVVGYDLTRLIIGSEGTLAVIVEATLKLTPKPAAVGGLTAHYGDAASCAAAIVAVMGQPRTPSALEFLDAGSLSLLRAHHPGLVPDAAQATLMIEVDGPAHEVEESAAAILDVCRNDGLVAAEPSRNSDELWAARRALSPLLRDIAPRKINEDVAVPVSRLPALLDGLASLTAKHRIANVNFGHGGNGNIHVNLLVDPGRGDELKRAEACLDEIFDLVVGLGGTLSGEHGVGSEKRAFIGKELDPTTIALMRRVKQLFDPVDILNPGKLFP